MVITGNRPYCTVPDEGTTLEDGQTWGKPADEERVIEGLTFPKCAAHAQQFATKRQPRKMAPRADHAGRRHIAILEAPDMVPAALEGLLSLVT